MGGEARRLKKSPLRFSANKERIGSIVQLKPLTATSTYKIHCGSHRIECLQVNEKSSRQFVQMTGILISYIEAKQILAGEPKIEKMQNKEKQNRK